MSPKEKKTEEKKTEEEVVEEEYNVTSDIDDMLSAFGHPAVKDSEETEKKEETKVEEDSDEIVDVDERDDDKKSADSEEGDTDSGDLEEDEDADAEQSDEDDQDEPDEKDKEITDLKSRLDILEAEKKAIDTKDDSEEEKETLEELTFETQDFIGELDVEDVFSNKDSVNELLNKVYQMGVTNSRDVVGDHILRSVPSIVDANIVLKEELMEARTKFYKDNPELEAFPKVVAAVFEEVSSKNPDKGYKDLLDEVGKEARSKLDLHKKATEKESSDIKKKEKSPRLPGKKGGRTSKEQPDVSSLESEIDEMNETVARR